MNTILFERHLFERTDVGSPLRRVAVHLHIDFANQTIFIGEAYNPWESMRDHNAGFDIACGPFRGTLEEVSAFVDVYREAFEFGKKRLDEVPKPTKP